MFFYQEIDKLYELWLTIHLQKKYFPLYLSRIAGNTTYCKVTSSKKYQDYWFACLNTQPDLKHSEGIYPYMIREDRGTHLNINGYAILDLGMPFHSMKSARIDAVPKRINFQKAQHRAIDIRLTSHAYGRTFLHERYGVREPVHVLYKYFPRTAYFHGKCMQYILTYAEQYFPHIQKTLLSLLRAVERLCTWDVIISDIPFFLPQSSSDMYNPPEITLPCETMNNTRHMFLLQCQSISSAYLSSNFLNNLPEKTEVSYPKLQRNMSVLILSGTNPDWADWVRCIARDHYGVTRVLPLCLFA